MVWSTRIDNSQTGQFGLVNLLAYLIEDSDKIIGVIF